MKFDYTLALAFVRHVDGRVRNAERKGENEKWRKRDPVNTVHEVPGSDGDNFAAT